MRQPKRRWPRPNPAASAHLRPARDGYCMACNAAKHTQCENILTNDGGWPCECACFDERTGTALWALTDEAENHPHLIAAHVMISRSLFVCGGSR